MLRYPFDRIIVEGKNIIGPSKRSQCLHNLSPCLFRQVEPRFEDLIGDPDGRRWEITSLDEQINTELKYELLHTLDIDMSDANEDDLESLKRVGYSLVHGESTLYQKYNIMVTFYRNLWFVSTVFAVVYLFRFWEVGLFLAIASLLFAARRLDFKKRQERALLNDMYIHLKRND